MKLVRFVAEGAAYSGTLEDSRVISGAKQWAAQSVRFLAPCRPTKIVCVARNYAEHAAEMGNDLPAEPLLFFKPASALNDPEADIIYPRQSTRVDYEGELAVVIGRRCRHVKSAEAFDVVKGYTILNDVTARDLQKTDGQWARAKGFDTFAPIGPCISTDVDPAKLMLRTLLNGELKQESTTDKLIFNIPLLIEYISAAFTLESDDVIATGTPRGVGPMRPGDAVEVEIEGIGILRNRVRAAA